MNAQDVSVPLWTPSPERVEQARVTHFRRFVEGRTGLQLPDYQALWQWSVDDSAGFWQLVWDYFQVQSPQPVLEVVDDAPMPDTRWFAGTRVNFARQVFQQSRGAAPAVLYAGEEQTPQALSWDELEQQVAALAAWLREQGVEVGDRVAAYLPNCPQALVAFLACASLGAVWSVCSPDMGATSVIDRFRQIAPKVLICCDGYRYSGKAFSREEVVAQICAELPSLRCKVLLPMLEPTLRWPGFANWQTLIQRQAELQPKWVEFSHPLWIVYSSGTTGTPKAIVHGHGGMILSLSASLGLHNDLGPEDTYLWYSTTGWIMWNCQIGGLLVGSTICLLDGNPGYPDVAALWRFAAACKATFIGAGAAYYAACLKAGISRAQMGDVSRIRSIGSTGSPLSADAYAWIYENFPDAWLSPMSGGTDIAGPFVAGVPVLPVYPGEMQCRVLGAAVQAFNDQGQPVYDEVGELVCTRPMPCMPVRFWNDDGNLRYQDSYFDTFPGIWRHGDWIRITPRGGAVIYGRSDATINRQGIRMGTAELYRAVEALDEVLDSLVVDLEYLERESYMPLFVVLKPGFSLDDELRQRMIQAIRQALTARHVPNEIIQVEQIPRTLTGKKLEVPIKRLMLGHELARVVNLDAMVNPQCLDWYVAFADRYLQRGV